MNISSNISSMQSHQQMLNVNASNIANVNTQDYSAKDGRVESGADDSTKVIVRQGPSGLGVNSNTDLTKEIPSMMVSQRATEVNMASIKTQDQMIGTLLDMKA